ncbi:mitochondrial dna helicase [Moniliophthora roreri]|uniref:ATP-dependent DNA helicase PIF1 n=1 Tax=Moniliophthora roreri TaxID=221103 RepID=A0A0W0FAU3_MONRR|nr:mitochondrial dna helicase [Moniliophthora roreri]
MQLPSPTPTPPAAQNETRYYVLVGPTSLQVFETASPLALGFKGFTTRDEAELWIEQYLQGKPEEPPTRPQTPDRDEYHSASHPRLFSPGREYPAPLARDEGSISVSEIPGSTIKLSAEQKKVLDIVVAGGNVFFTGPAGTGKSVLLREIVRTLRHMRPNNPESLAVTASTGIAGINIGGSTIHSFSGIRLGKEEDGPLARRIKGSRILSKRWQDLKTLIIDEISMLDGRIFDKLEFIAREVRRVRAPFGGIQLVLSGDFCQLPSVPDESHNHRLASTFCFDANSWRSCMPELPVVLTQVFRQNDKEFVDILARMRVGALTDPQIQKLQSLSRPLVYPDDIEPTELYPTRAEVDACNQKRMAGLSGTTHTYLAMDRAGHDVNGNMIPKEQVIKLLDKLLISPSTITLKEGSQVMLIKNIVQGSMVNGSIGRIIGFMTISEALKKQIAIATRKDKEESEDLTSRRPPPMVPLDKILFDDKKQLFPLVQFTSGAMLLCAPTNFTIEGYLGNVECERMQVPLILAWAMSIHKSQGQTLSRVKIDLRRIFERGQTYVAISRATSMENLEILNFNAVKVQAHPRVLEWQKEWQPVPLPVTPANPSQSDLDILMDSPSVHEDDFIWDEMDSEDAIQQYHSNFSVTSRK